MLAWSTICKINFRLSYWTGEVGVFEMTEGFSEQQLLNPNTSDPLPLMLGSPNRGQELQTYLNFCRELPTSHRKVETFSVK